MTLVYMPERPVLIELHTLPGVAYFSIIATASEVLLEGYEHYQKQTYRNRYYINTSHGKLRLTVPVDVPSGEKIGIRAVRVEAGLGWRNQHWRSIESAYRKAPFFEHYADELHSILFHSGTNFLWDLNRALLSFCLTQLRLPVCVSETVAYEHRPDAAILDVRNFLREPNQGAAHLFYQPQPYHQVFGNAFVGDCSIIDLLFCLGPQALHHVILSRKPTNK